MMAAGLFGAAGGDYSFITSLFLILAGAALPLSTKVFGRLVNEFALYQQGLIQKSDVYSIVDQFVSTFVLF